jgi:serine-type D-Ala-D-Ala carboxypeptidase (penicillin-binding protein 5/6)
MKVVHPSVYESRTRMYKKKSQAKNKILATVLAVSVLYVSYCMTRTPEPPKITVRDIVISTPKAIELGTYAESVSVGIEDFGQVAEVNGSVKKPTASTIKALTALVILHKKPLGTNEKGPSITFDAADRADYEKRYSEGESTVEIQPGQVMTEHEALEALMIGSANNIAYKLAVWAFGSEKEFLKEAEQYTNRIGLKDTVFSDASGLAAETRSSARDLQIVASEVVQQPSLRAIGGCGESYKYQQTSRR